MNLHYQPSGGRSKETSATTQPVLGVQGEFLAVEVEATVGDVELTSEGR
jgi:hypothetical protein